VRITFFSRKLKFRSIRLANWTWTYHKAGHIYFAHTFCPQAYYHAFLVQETCVVLNARHLSTAWNHDLQI